MVIDKSWTCLGRHEKALFTGLKKFTEHCKLLVNNSGNVKCPCKSCRNVSWVSIPDLLRHITNNGWDPSHKTWTNHGEPNVFPPVIHNTTQPQMMSDMTTCLNALSYIPPNNEQNEPTQRDIGKTSNEPTQAIRNEFEELYESANEELYLGCDYVTRLDFMAKFTNFEVKGKLTDFIFNEMLEFFQNVFPTTKGYKLPPSYYAIKKTFKTIGLGWKDSNTPRKKVPKKVLRYFLIIPRLQHFYKSSPTAKEMTWHATGKCTEPGKMQHPVDGRAWKNFDTKYPDFAKEPRNVRLGVETINVATGQKFNMIVMVLWTINDFSALSSLSGWSGQGYKACPICNEDTPSTRVLEKIAYVSHRRFLKKPHKWKRLLDFNGEIEDGDPPRKFVWDDIMAQLARLHMRVKGKHPMYGGVKIK
nr:hypothetical protein [Tanacetum cinerariifolium]